MVVEIFIPLVGGIIFLGTILCAMYMCYGKCPNYYRRWRENRQKEALIRSCSKVRFVKEISDTGCQNETCPVCLEDFLVNEFVTVCPCRHGYHKKCLIGWLLSNPLCPMCKSEIITQSHEINERTPLLT